MQIRKAVIVTFMAGAAFLVFALSPGSAAPQAMGSPEVVHSQNTNVLPPYEVFEITFLHDGQYADPFLDVTIEVTFTCKRPRSG